GAGEDARLAAGGALARPRRGGGGSRSAPRRLPLGLHGAEREAPGAGDATRQAGEVPGRGRGEEGRGFHRWNDREALGAVEAQGARGRLAKVTSWRRTASSRSTAAACGAYSPRASSIACSSKPDSSTGPSSWPAPPPEAS